MTKNETIQKLVGVILEANEKGACIRFEINGHVPWIEVRMSESKERYHEKMEVPHCNNNTGEVYLGDEPVKILQEIIDFISAKYLQ